MTLPLVVKQLVLDVVPVDGESLHEPIGVDRVTGHSFHELVLRVRILLHDALVLFQIPAISIKKKQSSSRVTRPSVFLCISTKNPENPSKVSVNHLKSHPLN